MTCIVADPYLLLLPDPCNSSEQLDIFVEGLLNWSDAASRKDIPMFISDACISGLYADNWYPYHGRLSPLFKQYGIENADEETINQVIRNIFDKTPRLEDHLEIANVLYEEQSVVVSPDIFLKRLGENTSKALSHTLVLMGIGEKCIGSVLPECYIATNENLHIQENDKVTTSSEVHLIELTENSQYHICEENLPKTIKNDLTVCFGYDNVLASMDIMALWDGASSPGKVTDTINKMLIHHREAGLPPDRKEFCTYRLGTHFLESIHTYGFHARPDWARLLIDSCARIILGIPKNDVDAFREDERPQSAQRTRKSDQALAWRTHLTKSNEGFRLMFWTTSDGIVEFTNVGPKKELIIYE